MSANICQLLNFYFFPLITAGVSFSPVNFAGSHCKSIRLPGFQILPGITEALCGFQILPGTFCPGLIRNDIFVSPWHLIPFYSSFLLPGRYFKLHICRICGSIQRSVGLAEHLLFIYGPVRLYCKPITGGRPELFHSTGSSAGGYRCQLLPFFFFILIF